MKITEAFQENKFIKHLIEEQKYIKLDINVEEILYIIFLNLERINKINLTEENKEEIKRKFNQHNINSFYFAQMLLGKEKIKIDKNNNRQEKIYLNFIDWENWNNNKFYVIQQLRSENSAEKNKKRFDTLILINGFPLILFELKNTNVSVEEAVAQIIGYREEILQENIFRFTQILVSSNFNEIKLLPNNSGQSKNFAFKWNSKNGSDMQSFISDFLNHNKLKDYLEKFIFLQRQEEKVILLRPYQQRAIEKTLNFIEKKLQTNNINPDYNQNNGYIWHTTGSGKTLTSFKIMQLLQANKNIDKILFIVDRNDLNEQTEKEFQKTFSNENNYKNQKYLNQENSRELLELLKSNTKLIFTSIQKLNNVVKDYFNELSNFMDKTYILIFDECHRSISGTMLNRIKHNFKKSILIGFSGTPIFENEEGSFETTNIFGTQLDVYNMKNAFKDESVLGFQLRNKNELILIPNNDLDKHKMILDEIDKMHHKYTEYQKFNAIMAFDNVTDLLQFYNLYLKNSEKKLSNIFITPIFSKENDNDAENDLNENDSNLNEWKEKILQRYNEKFLTSFTLETFNDYINDVRVRFKKNNKQNKNQIDIVLVVNMLLTGYDSPKTNTLYVNKSLKNHNLIQAFSRTNRIFDFNKKHGYIVNFSLEKNTIDEAFKKYADAKEDQIIEIVYGKTWDQTLENAKKFLSDLYIQFEKIYDIKNDKLKENSSIEERRYYLKLFSNLATEFSNLKTYPEYNNTEKIKGFNLDEYKRFEGYCNDIYDSLTASEQNSSEYRIISSSNMNSVDEIIKIDIDYLNNLLFQKNDLKGIFLNDEFKIEDIKKFEKEKKQFLDNFSYINKNNNKEINLHLNEFYEGYCLHIHEIFNQKEKWTKKDFNAILEFQKKEIIEKLLVQMQKNIVRKIKENFPLIDEDDMKKDFFNRIKEEDWTDINDSKWIKKWKRQNSNVTSYDASKLKTDYENKLIFYIKFKNKIKSENQGEN